MKQTKSKRTKPNQTEAEIYKTKLCRRKPDRTKRNNIVPNSTNPNKIKQNEQKTVPHQIQRKRTELHRCYKLHNKSVFRKFENQTSICRTAILFENFFLGGRGFTRSRNDKYRAVTYSSTRSLSIRSN